MADFQVGFGQGLSSSCCAANTALVVTIPAPGDNLAIVIDQIDYGFDFTPTRSKDLSIVSNGVEVWRVPVITGGLQLPIKPPQILRVENVAVVVTLPADTGGAKGYLNVWYHVDRVSS